MVKKMIGCRSVVGIGRLTRRRTLAEPISEADRTRTQVAAGVGDPPFNSSQPLTTIV